MSNAIEQALKSAYYALSDGGREAFLQKHPEVRGIVAQPEGSVTGQHPATVTLAPTQPPASADPNWVWNGKRWGPKQAPPEPAPQPVKLPSGTGPVGGGNYVPPPAPELAKYGHVQGSYVPPPPGYVSKAGSPQPHLQNRTFQPSPATPMIPQQATLAPPVILPPVSAETPRPPIPAQSFAPQPAQNAAGERPMTAEEIALVAAARAAPGGALVIPPPPSRIAPPVPQQQQTATALAAPEPAPAAPHVDPVEAQRQKAIAAAQSQKM